jgi:Spy/CpxP family protein refolding chaperone
MKNVMSRTSVIAVALLALTSAAFAQGPGPRGRRPDDGGGRPGFGPSPEQLAERLNLSDDQKAQWQSLREKQRDATKPLFDGARQAHEAFQNALEAAHPDVTNVGQAALAVHAAEKKLHEAQQAAFEEMKSILTPEQREKLEQSRERGQGGLRRGGPDGPRPRG